MKKLSESIWSDMQDRSAGDTVRQEDMITTNEDLRKKIIELSIEQGGGDTLDVSSLTNCIKCDDFSYIFGGFKKVKHIIGLEDWDVSKVTNMKGMFYNCGNFNSDLSKWNVSEVTDIHGMFYNCKNFNADLSNWDVSSVKNMHSMFFGCKDFNSDLSKWDVSNVENMYGMFWGCINFNSDLSKWNVRKVKNIGDVFYNCKSLKQIPSWYMKYYQKTNESIWSDMQDRSAGETIRKEDDINLLDSDELYDYLNNHYKGIVPYALIFNTYGILSVPIIRDVTNMCIMYNPESKMNAVSIPSEIVTNVDGLLNLLHDNFLVKEMNGKNNEYTIYLVSPKDLSKITNKFFIDVIDFLLENIPESPNYRKSIKKIEK